MKKLLFLFLLVFMFSCEKQKEPTYCWRCELKCLMFGTTESKVCDKTAAEIIEIEKTAKDILCTKTCTRY